MTELETDLRTPVPDGFKVHDSQVGIKQEAKGALKIISKCARYGETALRIIIQAKYNDNYGTLTISEGEISCLFACVACSTIKFFAERIYQLSGQINIR